jgi:hypothetical protein
MWKQQSVLRYPTDGTLLGREMNAAARIDEYLFAEADRAVIGLQVAADEIEQR